MGDPCHRRVWQVCVQDFAPVTVTFKTWCSSLPRGRCAVHTLLPPSCSSLALGCRPRPVASWNTLAFQFCQVTSHPTFRLGSSFTSCWKPPLTLLGRASCLSVCMCSKPCGLGEGPPAFLTPRDWRPENQPGVIAIHLHVHLLPGVIAIHLHIQHDGEVDGDFGDVCC